MRPILALAILLLALSSAAPEPEYSSFFADYLHADGGNAVASPIEIESATGRADRLAVASLGPHAIPVEILKPGDDAGSAVFDANAADAGSVPDRAGDISLNDVCNALFTSAQDNNLPLAFFANLIWQESRLHDDAVSPKGALGIAQFMPQTAADSGLDDPFDPLQAIPASARLLNELRLEFGNLGFVAAAYNAGARRVADWLEHRASLPRETRGYVVRVTGLSVDAWRRIAVADDALTFARPLPCRSLPTFASFEQEQSAVARLEQVKLAQQQARLAAAAHARDAGRKREHGRREVSRAVHDRRTGKREAARHKRAGAGREKHNSV